MFNINLDSETSFAFLFLTFFPGFVFLQLYRITSKHNESMGEIQWAGNSFLLGLAILGFYTLGYKYIKGMTPPISNLNEVGTYFGTILIPCVVFGCVGLFEKKLFNVFSISLNPAWKAYLRSLRK